MHNSRKKYHVGTPASEAKDQKTIFTPSINSVAITAEDAGVWTKGHIFGYNDSVFTSQAGVYGVLESTNWIKNREYSWT